jgi:hypothetical protein
MAFEPTPLDFSQSDVDKIVKYKERTDALPDWIVSSVKFGSASLDRTRWSFLKDSVFQDPDSSSREQGTLHFKADGLATSTTTEDQLLRALWQQAPQEISVNISCTTSNQTHTLTVRLV